MPTICVSAKRDFLKGSSFRGLDLRISASKSGLLQGLPVTSQLRTRTLNKRIHDELLNVQSIVSIFEARRLASYVHPRSTLPL